MNRFEANLRIPGPTPMPPSVREAGARQMTNHRGPEFTVILERIVDRLRPYFGTAGDVAILSSVGTGGLEATVVNTVSPGDRVLAVSIGLFGDRLAEIAEVYGATVSRLSFDWGLAADPAVLRVHLEENPGYRAVLLTHSETSTGVLNPIAQLAAEIRAVQPDALIVVDGVSAVGAVPFEMDAWGLDVVVTASQKAWMAAPGLAMIAVAERAWPAIDAVTTPRFYFDLRKARHAQAAGLTAWTPALSVVYQVDAGLELMAAEGADAIFARHEACAAATRAGLAALGIRLFADAAHRSPTVTAAWLPDGVRWPDFQASAKARGVILADGLGPIAGRIFRIGHLGSVTLPEILDTIGVLEEVLIGFGRPVQPGVGVGAAQAAALERSSAACVSGSGPEGTRCSKRPARLPVGPF